MNHSGKPLKAALRIIFWTLVLLLALFAAGVLATLLGSVVAMISSVLVGLWILFVLFTLYFFRDPEPVKATSPDAVVAPGHGKVDVIDETTEPDVMGGRCKRISIFLSVFDVHVQQAPVAGTVSYLKHKPGLFLNALKTESAAHNENVLIGFRPEGPGARAIGVRLITGLIARRIIPWVQVGDVAGKGERISLIQFGSRVDVYLPLDATVSVKLGDRVVGGETVVAQF